MDEDTLLSSLCDYLEASLEHRQYHQSTLMNSHNRYAGIGEAEIRLENEVMRVRSEEVGRRVELEHCRNKFEVWASNYKEILNNVIAGMLSEGNTDAFESQFKGFFAECRDRIRDLEVMSAEYKKEKANLETAIRKSQSSKEAKEIASLMECFRIEFEKNFFLKAKLEMEKFMQSQLAENHNLLINKTKDDSKRGGKLLSAQHKLSDMIEIIQKELRIIEHDMVR